MLNKRFSLLFFLKKPRKAKQETFSIYLRITVNSERAELSLQRSCNPSKWNSHSGKINGTKEEAKSLNAYLDSIQVKVYDIHKSQLEGDRPITAEGIKNELLGVRQRKMVLDVYQQHNDRLKELVGKDYSPTTLKRDQTSLEHTRNFIQWKYKTSDFGIDKLDYEFISEYAFWLKSVRNCNQNSTIKYLTNFKKVVLPSVKNGWLSRDPFMNFQLVRKEVERIALTEPELRSIFLRTFSTDRLNQVRDIFLFSCYTGLAYIDVQKLKQTDIVPGFDNDKWLSIKRQKTQIPSKFLYYL